VTIQQRCSICCLQEPQSSDEEPSGPPKRRPSANKKVDEVGLLPETPQHELLLTSHIVGAGGRQPAPAPQASAVCAANQLGAVMLRHYTKQLI